MKLNLILLPQLLRTTHEVLGSLHLSSERFWKFVESWQSYRYELRVLLFWNTVYIETLSFRTIVPSTLKGMSDER